MADTRRWFWLGGVILLCAFFWLLHPILTPFLVALLLAYLFDPSCRSAGESRSVQDLGRDSGVRAIYLDLHHVAIGVGADARQTIVSLVRTDAADARLVAAQRTALGAIEIWPGGRFLEIRQAQGSG